MRQLISRLSRVGDSSSPSSSSPGRRRGVVGCAGGGKKPHAGVPEGHVPVYVVAGDGGGGEAERFMVRAELLGRPALAELLGRAAQVYGYNHEGPLRIPCHADVFRRALTAAAAGDDYE